MLLKKIRYCWKKISGFCVKNPLGKNRWFLREKSLLWKKISVFCKKNKRKNPFLGKKSGFCVKNPFFGEKKLHTEVWLTGI
jgi:hypothetical protein